MFERYTEKARLVIVCARYEASLLGSNFIEPPHLMLGLLREDKGLFVTLSGSAKPFENPGELMGLKASGENVSTSVDLPVSPGSQRVLIFAAEESERLNHEHVTPGHLVLGLLREPGAARDLLEKSGLTLALVREVLMRSLRLPIALEALAGRTSPPTNQRTIAELRAQFGMMMDRLTPELEPAVVYSPRLEQAT